MTDETKTLVKRLRLVPENALASAAAWEAADTIEALTAERDALRSENERLKLLICDQCAEAVGALKAYNEPRATRIWNEVRAALGDGDAS